MISMEDLANILRKQGNYKESEKLYQQTSELSKSLLGPKHPDTVTKSSNLAVTLLDHGDHERAEILTREALGLRTDIPGLNHFGTLENMNTLAVILRHQGAIDEAEDLSRQEFELKIKKLDLRCLELPNEEQYQSHPSAEQAE